MPLTTIQTRAIALRQQWPIAQFGQSAAGCVYTVGGKYGCGHTFVQFVARLAGKGSWTHDAISKRISYPNMSRVTPSKRRGLSTGEAIAFLRSIGIPYEYRTFPTHAELVSLAQRGPVGLVIEYAWWPEWKDYDYFGRVADGKPNGFAGPLREAGANQIGLTLAHWGTFLGQDTYTTANGGTGYVEYTWESNHRSSSRPEAVAIDKITPAQLTALLRSRAGVCLVPSKPLPLAA